MITGLSQRWNPEHGTAGESAGTPGHDAVRAELERILAARDFKASERLRTLLGHLVSLSLAGRHRELSQRHLAETVFARGPDFDPERDAIVRVEIRKLRQALDLYYSKAGKQDPVIISIPTGTYEPRFSWKESSRTLGEVQNQRGEEPIDPMGIAVLPFADLGSEPGSEWIVPGLAAELCTILGRIPELHVSPPYALPEVADTRSRLSWAGETLRVRFALEGAVQGTSGRVRVTVRLHDLVRHRQIWSNRYDRDLSIASRLDIQEDIARDVVSEAVDLFTGAMGRSLRNEAVQSVGRGSVYEAVLAFHRYLHLTSDDAYRIARRALETAVDDDPSAPLLLAMLADLRRAGFSLGFTDERDPMQTVFDLLNRAISLAPDCLPCRVSMCFALLHQRNRAGLMEQVEIILGDAAAPASYRSDVGVPLALSGEWDRGCGLIEAQFEGTRLYPHYLQYPLFLRAYRQGDYEQARRLADGFRPAPFFWQPLLRAAVYGKLDEREEARRQRGELMALRPDCEVQLQRYLSCFIMEDDLVHDLLDGLARAGLHAQ